MINTSDFIQYRNVVVKNYKFHYMEMDAVMHNFLESLYESGVTIKGPLTYSMNNLPLDKHMDCDFIMPVLDEAPSLPEDMVFYSYYELYDMLSLVVNEPVEVNMEIKLAELLINIENNHLKQVTPLYHVLPRDDSMKYIILKMGVTRGD